MNIQLTDHAEKRLIERTGISISTFKGMYKEGRYLSTGKEEKSRRIHDLFFCIDDKTFFVSIRDEKNNEIVTILPLDYHENLAWEISIEAQRLVKCITLGEEVSSEIKQTKIESEKPSVFRVKAFDDKNFKRQTICTIFANKYAFDFDLLIESDEFKIEIRDFFLDVNWASFTDIAIDLKTWKLLFLFPFLPGQLLQRVMRMQKQKKMKKMRRASFTDIEINIGDNKNLNRKVIPRKLIIGF